MWRQVILHILLTRPPLQLSMPDGREGERAETEEQLFRVPVAEGCCAAGGIQTRRFVPADQRLYSPIGPACVFGVLLRWWRQLRWRQSRGGRQVLPASLYDQSQLHTGSVAGVGRAAGTSTCWRMSWHRTKTHAWCWWGWWAGWRGHPGGWAGESLSPCSSCSGAAMPECQRGLELHTAHRVCSKTANTQDFTEVHRRPNEAHTQLVYTKSTQHQRTS